MADTASRGVICRSGDLVEDGKGVCFTVEIGGQLHPAFAIRYRNRIYAYLNRCAHRGVTLDWDNGRFFDITGSYLVCSTHGALYEPDIGRCAGGPCRGLGLTKLDVTENDGQVRLDRHDNILLVEPSVTG